MPTSYYCICDFKQCKDKVSSGNANVTYFKLPVDEEAGKHWLRKLVSSPASRLDLLKDGWGKLIASSARVASHHFSKNFIIVSSKRSVLKKHGSVPTRQVSSPLGKRKAPNERVYDRTMQQLESDTAGISGSPAKVLKRTLRVNAEEKSALEDEVTEVRAHCAIFFYCISINLGLVAYPQYLLCVVRLVTYRVGECPQEGDRIGNQASSGAREGGAGGNQAGGGAH
jgi:hypothetical protein